MFYKNKLCRHLPNTSATIIATLVVVATPNVATMVVAANPSAATHSVVTHDTETLTRSLLQLCNNSPINHIIVTRE